MSAICGRRAVIGRRLAPLWRSSVRSFSQFSARQIEVGAPFLTGSAPQTEFDVTHSKQTPEKFLTGARTHIKDFKIRHVIRLSRALSASHDRAFEGISNRNCSTFRNRRNSLKTNDRHISNRNQNCLARITPENRNAEACPPRRACAGKAEQKVRDINTERLRRAISLRGGGVGGGGAEAGEGFGFVLECGDGV